jgi:hypothetical protein
MGVLGLGLDVIISSMVTKYFNIFDRFYVQLLMYISCVLPDEFDCQ